MGSFSNIIVFLFARPLIFVNCFAILESISNFTILNLSIISI